METVRVRLFYNPTACFITNSFLIRPKIEHWDLKLNKWIHECRIQKYSQTNKTDEMPKMRKYNTENRKEPESGGKKMKNRKWIFAYNIYLILKLMSSQPSDDQLKQAIDKIFDKYDTDKSGTL